MTLPGSCTACGAVNKLDDKFCGGCGVAMTVDKKPTAIVTPPVVAVTIPHVPRKPPPAPRKKTVAIETLDDVVISEAFVGV